MDKNANRDPRFRPVVRAVGAARSISKLPRLPRVALVRGPILSTDRAFNNEAVPAIGLAYILGYLKGRGLDATLVDGVAEGLNRVWPVEWIPGYRCQGLPLDETVDRIPQDAEIIGVSTMFSGEWPLQRELLRRIRERFPNALLVAGGEHVTALSEYVLREVPELDLCVRGEGEHVFYEIVVDVASGGDGRGVAGVSFLDDGGVYRESSGLTRVEDIDNMPWPYWPDGYMEKFWAVGKSYGVQTERDMPLMVSRGCPFQCTFCSSPRMWTTRYMLRSVDDVIAEMRHYIERYDATAFQLYDLTAITKKSWAVELCQRMIKEGIRVNWSLPSGTRSESLDGEVLALLKQTGCNYLVYAPESGSSRVLDLIKKKISLDNLTESALMARDLGLVIRTNLIIGFPGETRADVFRTVRYGLHLAIRGVDEVSINIFSPYPGSELFEDLCDKGRIDLDDTFFLALTSLNSDYTRLNPLTVNERMGSRELGLYRIFFMLTNYALGYIIYPVRILRTIRNMWFGGKASTVFEHRLKDAAKRRAA